MEKYILAIDQGTTGSTAILVNLQGELIASEDQDFQQIFPKPGWVEHDAEVIWQGLEQIIKKLLQKTQISAKQIECIGITNQRETVVAWDRLSSRPIYHAIVWQCRRTQDFCSRINAKDVQYIKKTTGLVIDPYFSASKMRWLLKEVPESKELLKQNRLLMGTIDSFLIWKLTGGSHKTDVSNASRTQLMNLETLNWDQRLLKIFSVPEKVLPEISPSGGLFGTTKGLSFLPDGIKITGVIGDQQAALFGQTCFSQGEAKCTFGTGSFILLNTGTKPVRSEKNLLTTVAWKIHHKPAVYALEGGAFICGAAVQWLRDELGIIKTSQEIEELAMKVENSGGVEFVPALSGLGAPYWQAQARGLICGLTRGSNRAHIARATLEAMALQNADILISMQQDLGKKLKALKVDGGASSNQLLMQLQADYLQVRVIRPRVIETTSLGAAFMAGLGAGIWGSLDELLNLWRVDRTFEPKLKAKEQKSRLKAWHTAVKRSF